MTLSANPACVNKQKSWVVMRHDRGGSDEIMLFGLEEVHEGVADFLPELGMSAACAGLQYHDDA